MMKKINLVCSVTLSTFFLYCPIGSSLGNSLDFEETPLFIGRIVDPSGFILLDDSGSMDWEILTGPYWDPCAYDPNLSEQYHAAPTCGSLINNQGMMKTFANKSYRHFSYIYTNQDNLYHANNSCDASEHNALENCVEKGLSDWRMLSSSLNFLYYNPNIRYLPWVGPCKKDNSMCQPALFSSVRSNPKEGSMGFDLIKDLSKNTLASYHVWIDNKGFVAADMRPLKSTQLNVTHTPNNIVDLWDSHLQFIFTESNTVEIIQHDYSPNEKSIGLTAKNIATLSDKQACYSILGLNVLAPTDIRHPTALNGPSCQTISQAQQNFANWYQYHRKRNYVAKNALVNLINNQPTFRFGFTTLTQFDKNFIAPPAEAATEAYDYNQHNKQLITELFDLPLTKNSSPIRIALDQVGKYYSGELSGKNNPITSACQKNIALILTDGYWNDPQVNVKIWDTDKDGIPLTLADVARYYYLKDLSPLANYVATDAFDTASWQHLSVFGLNFGHTGKLVDTDGDGWPNPPLKENSDWGNPNFSFAEKMDDLWHAAYNSKGAYESIFNEKALTQKLNRFLMTAKNHHSSASAPALSTSKINERPNAYFAYFNSLNWTGDLSSYAITNEPNADLSPQWQAKIKNHADRVIITKGWRQNDNGVPFRWPHDFIEIKKQNKLSPQALLLLNQAPHEAEAAHLYGEKLINYLRGDKTQEASTFRKRTGLLGDMIHSPPVYVDSPLRNYPDTLEAKPYTQFKKQYASRMPMVYVGANDGMLHGFEAKTGEEKLAYVPGMSDIFKNLPSLSVSPYLHHYFVDGPLTEVDAYIQNQWQTLLIGTARQGGKGVFALNITDPNAFLEKNADSILLWEFTEKDDPGVGYLFNAPHVTKLRYAGNQHKWAVIFGNGYQTSETALYILFIEMGLDGTWTVDTDYLKIPVQRNENQKIAGISSIYPVDIDGDYITDYVYGADLNGHIWKFDLTDAIPKNWGNKVTHFFSASFATSGDQPISAPLVVTSHPLGKEKGVMIYFGTGKYLESGDTTVASAMTQSFYGLWDKLDGSVPTKNDLLKQSILNEIAKNQKVLRQVSHSDINWVAPKQIGEIKQHLGWYLDFFVSGRQTNQGEKMITQPLVQNGKIIFTTLIPNENPCDFGGQSWLMTLNAENGGALSDFSFDLNEDMKFDEQDSITVDNQGNKAIPAGLLSTVGILPTPTLISSEDKNKTMILLNGNTGITSVLQKTGSLGIGRQQIKIIK